MSQYGFIQNLIPLGLAHSSCLLTNVLYFFILRISAYDDFVGRWKCHEEGNAPGGCSPQARQTDAYVSGETGPPWQNISTRCIGPRVWSTLFSNTCLFLAYRPTQGDLAQSQASHAPLY